MTERSDWVVTVTPTIMDGTVVRWYANLDAAEHGRELASASRNRVEYLRDDPPARLRDAVEAAHRELAADRDADVRHYATHTHPLFGELTPVTP